VRDRIKVYSWIGGDRPADTAAAAQAAADRGFTAIKMNGTAELQIIDTWDRSRRPLIGSLLCGMRAHAGDRRDFHGRVTSRWRRRC
jgi:galactonate dehydratase